MIYKVGPGKPLAVRWVTAGNHFCDTLSQRTVAASPPLTNAPGRRVGAARITRALSDTSRLSGTLWADAPHQPARIFRLISLCCSFLSGYSVSFQKQTQNRIFL